mgnify:CR=1 FL=1
MAKKKSMRRWTNPVGFRFTEAEMATFEALRSRLLPGVTLDRTAVLRRLLHDAAQTHGLPVELPAGTEHTS